MIPPAVITVDYIRQLVQDRGPEDNSIECDKFFSDEEIVRAMEQCAAAYNSTPPLGVDLMTAHAMPAHEGVFVDGTLANLYKMARQKLARNLMTWSTGNTTVELEKSRMEAFSTLQKELEASFREAATNRKIAINRSFAFGMY